MADHQHPDQMPTAAPAEPGTAESVTADPAASESGTVESAAAEDAITEPAAAEPAPAAVEADASQAPPSRYARMAAPTSVRNVVWALGLTMGVVAVVAVLFFGVGNDPQREVPESNRVDVAASAERAQELAPFTVAVPESADGWSADGWTAKQARYTDGADPRWSVRYSAPSGALVTLAQAPAITPALIQDAVAGARSDGTVEVEGATCEVYTGTGEGDGDDGADGDGPGAGAARVLACPGEGWGIVVSGKTEQEELVDLAGAAIRSARS